MADRNQNPARRHHYLPQRYQNGFARDGTLWVYDRELLNFRPSAPKTNAVVRHFYSLDVLENGKSPVLENELANLEGRVWPLLDRLSTRPWTIGPLEKRELSLFFAFLRTRVPAFDKQLNDIKLQYLQSWVQETFATPEDLANAVKEATGEELPTDQIGRIHTELARGLTVDPQRHNNLLDILDITPRWAKTFFERTWSVLTAPREVSYILGDNPVVLICPRDRDPSRGMIHHADPEATTLVPLTASHALLMSHFDGNASISKTRAGAGWVRGANIAMAQNCDRFLMARDESHLRHIVQRQGWDTDGLPPRAQEVSESELAEQTHP